MLLNCGVGEDFESPLDWKEIQPIHPKGNQSLEALILAHLMLKLKLQFLPTWCEELTHWLRPWCWARLKAGGEEDDRGWDGWMASPTRWTWVWASSGSWWWAGKPGMVQSMGLQRVRHEWATELNWIFHGIDIWHFVYPLIDWSAFRFLFFLLWIMLLWTFVHRFLCELIFKIFKYCWFAVLVSVVSVSHSVMSDSVIHRL